MTPGGLVERRDPHETVDAGLGRQQAVRVFAGDRQRRALEAGFVARLIVDQLAPEPTAFRPAQIHPQQHLGPVLRLGPAGARMDGDDRVLPVVRAAEHLLDLARLHLLIERFERLTEFRIHRFARLGPFDEDGEIVALLAERRDQIAVLFQAFTALLHFLGFSRVFPEVGGGGARLQAGQFLLRAGGFKDSSADRRRVC